MPTAECAAGGFGAEGFEVAYIARFVGQYNITVQLRGDLLHSSQVPADASVRRSG